MKNKLLTLFCYPKLFGLADNNPFGLKVYAYLKLANIRVELENILDASRASRNQLPYIHHNDQFISDSSKIIEYLDEYYQVDMDRELNASEKSLCYLIDSLLGNHLYWIIAYSRWQDDRYWPCFKKEFLNAILELTEENLEQARQVNIKKYMAQGIGRYTSEEIYQSGINDLNVLINRLLGNKDYLFGDKPHIIDASCYGFLANVYFAPLDTELKLYICSSGLAKYVERMHQNVNY